MKSGCWMTVQELEVDVTKTSSCGPYVWWWGRVRSRRVAFLNRRVKDQRTRRRIDNFCSMAKLVPSLCVCCTENKSSSSNALFLYVFACDCLHRFKKCFCCCDVFNSWTHHSEHQKESASRVDHRVFQREMTRVCAMWCTDVRHMDI